MNDAIESGLVKTPRVAVRDDATIGMIKVKVFHLYNYVKDDLNRRVDENVGLPDLLLRQKHASNDWLNTRGVGSVSRPLQFYCKQQKRTAARVSHYILNGFSSIQELEDEAKFIRIDQDALEKLNLTKAVPKMKYNKLKEINSTQ